MAGTEIICRDETDSLNSSMVFDSQGFRSHSYQYDDSRLVFTALIAVCYSLDSLSLHYTFFSLMSHSWIFHLSSMLRAQAERQDTRRRPSSCSHGRNSDSMGTSPYGSPAPTQSTNTMMHTYIHISIPSNTVHITPTFPTNLQKFNLMWNLNLTS